MQGRIIAILVVAGCGGNDAKLDVILNALRQQKEPAGNLTFEFASSQPEVAYTYRLDNRAPEPAGEVLRIEGLARGPHRLEIVASAPDGSMAAAPLVVEWFQDGQPAVLRVTSPPRTSFIEDELEFLGWASIDIDPGSGIAFLTTARETVAIDLNTGDRAYLGR